MKQVKNGEHRFIPPSEEQTKACLAWLARGMQREGQTIFRIEELQPTWLASLWQQWIYYLASRQAKGLMSALMIGHLGTLMAMGMDDHVGTAKYLLTMSLLIGPSIGLMGGLLDLLHSRRSQADSRRGGSSRSSEISRADYIVLFCLASFLVLLVIGPNCSFIFGLPLGFLLTRLWTSLNFEPHPATDIKPSETLRLSTASLRKIFAEPKMRWYHIAIVYLGIGAIGCILFFFGMGEPSLLAVAAILSAVFLVVTGTLNSAVHTLKTKPNQGVILSARNGIFVGSFYGTCIGALTISVVGVQDWQAGALIGLAGAAAVGLVYGGLPTIQHYILRFLLWRAGAIPWHYADFLDYTAEELHFLQKVGGGYIFVHRYLLEHFAAMVLQGEGFKPRPAAEATS